MLLIDSLVMIIVCISMPHVVYGASASDSDRKVVLLRSARSTINYTESRSAVNYTELCMRGKINKVKRKFSSLTMNDATKLDRYGCTPLHALTIVEDYREHVSLYCAIPETVRKSMIHTPDAYGLLPIAYSVMLSPAQLTEYLLQNGAGAVHAKKEGHAPPKDGAFMQIPTIIETLRAVSFSPHIVRGTIELKDTKMTLMMLAKKREEAAKKVNSVEQQEESRKTMKLLCRPTGLETINKSSVGASSSIR